MPFQLHKSNFSSQNRSTGFCSPYLSTSHWEVCWIIDFWTIPMTEVTEVNFCHFPSFEFLACSVLQTNVPKTAVDANHCPFNSFKFSLCNNKTSFGNMLCFLDFLVLSWLSSLSWNPISSSISRLRHTLCKIGLKKKLASLYTLKFDYVARKPKYRTLLLKLKFMLDTKLDINIRYKKCV